MEDFVTWEMLSDFVKLTGIVFATTQFVKNFPFLKKIPTQYLSWMIAFLLILFTHLQGGNFAVLDILLYLLSAIFISSSANGIFDLGKLGLRKKQKDETIDENEFYTDGELEILNFENKEV